MINCKKCNGLIESDSRFCKYCRTPISQSSNTDSSITCPSGHAIDPSWGNCPICGWEGASSSGNANNLRTNNDKPMPDYPYTPRKTKVQSGHDNNQGGNQSSMSTNAKKTRVVGSNQNNQNISTPQQAGTRAITPNPAPAPNPVQSQSNPQPSSNRTKIHGVHPTEIKPQPDLPDTPLLGFLYSFSQAPNGISYELRQGRIKIGKENSPDIDFCIPYDPTISRYHATIVCHSKKIVIRDEMTTNGTTINDDEVLIGESRVLRHLDTIKMGASEFRIIILEELFNKPNKKKKKIPKTKDIEMETEEEEENEE